MHVRPDNPLIVQGDGKVLLETKHKKYEEVRDFLSRFAEIETSPEHLHTYRIHPLSLWNAASSGLKRDAIIEGLRSYSKFDVPPDVLTRVGETMDRYGLVKLVTHPTDATLLRLEFATAFIAKTIGNLKSVQELLIPDGSRYFAVQGGHRGIFKQRLLNEGWPVEDLAGFLPGDPLPFELRENMVGNGKPFVIRDYQQASADRWFQEGQPSGGHGVIVLPCGAGKTIVAIAAMQKVQQHTLILATNGAAVQQWVREILDKTTLTPNDVGAYTGDSKEIRPVTVATYQILTWRSSREKEFAHLHLFRDRNWGMLVYDEVHLLPAPVFGATADVQARRRLGLTATLVREDGREGDVFSLVGPRRYDMAWQTLEERGFIAEARCFEVRVDFTKAARVRYENTREAEKAHMASANPEKLPALATLLKKHAEDNVLVIGTYLDQLKQIAALYRAPLITGETPGREREVLFQKFRDGTIKLLIVSKVANFSIDLPDANVAIQVSGSYGSRQEEAQRLGRVLRPKKNGAWFYSIVTRETKEQEFAMKRQLFLTEQGYRYHIQEAGQPAVTK
jgi:DNA excision repair protein ERCC-3